MNNITENYVEVVVIGHTKLEGGEEYFEPARHDDAQDLQRLKDEIVRFIATKFICHRNLKLLLNNTVPTIDLHITLNTNLSDEDI